MRRVHWAGRSAALRRGVGAFAAGVLVLAAGLWAAGYEPGLALGALWRGAFGSWDALFSATLARAVPLITIGLAVALAFRTGALNIGGEGQFYAGAIVAAWIGVRVAGWPGPLAVTAVLSGALLAGVLWIAPAVWLKWRFGVLEVISTLLLNFVADATLSYSVTGPLQEARAVYPQSDLLANAARLPVFPGSRLHVGILLVVVVAGVLWLVLQRTVWGFRLRAVGAGAHAAWISGRIPPKRVVAQALLWSGALAGLAGGMEISGVTYRLYQNLSPGYGFTAIAVALLARLNPLGVILTGLLFGALEAGGQGMQREAGVPAVTVALAEATIIIALLLADAAARKVLTGVAPQAAQEA